MFTENNADKRQGSSVSIVLGICNSDIVVFKVVKTVNVVFTTCHILRNDKVSCYYYTVKLYMSGHDTTRTQLQLQEASKGFQFITHVNISGIQQPVFSFCIQTTFLKCFFGLTELNQNTQGMVWKCDSMGSV